MTGKLSGRNRDFVLAVAFGLVSLSLLFEGTLFGQRSDKATVVTFNSPVEIPGSNPQVLPAGTYMFKLVDSKSTPHIVQVSNKEESKVYSTIMAIPAHRDTTTRNTVITFEERGGGQPQAVQTWFYPNDISGEEFVYSGKAPQQVAAVTPAPPVAETPKTTTPETSTVSETPTPTPARTPTPTPAPTPQAESTPPPQPAPQEAAAPPPQAPQPANPAPEQQPQALPRTASNLPLLLLAGVLSLGAGLTLRRFSRG